MSLARNPRRQQGRPPGAGGLPAGDSSAGAGGGAGCGVAKPGLAGLEALEAHGIWVAGPMARSWPFKSACQFPLRSVFLWKSQVGAVGMGITGWYREKGGFAQWHWKPEQG